MNYKKCILLFLLNLFYAVTALSSADDYRKRFGKAGFAPGTKILGIEEEFLDIEESVFMPLIAADPEGFEPEPMVQVKEVMRHEVPETFKLSFQGVSESLVLAPDQKVLVRIQGEEEEEEEPKPEWIEAQNLELGAEVFARRGQIRKLSELERIEANQETFEDPVYAIELNKIHTFYVGEECQIVAHNVVGAAISFTWNIGQGLVASVPQLLAASLAASIITDACEENAREHGAGSAITPQDITNHIASKLSPKETKLEVKEEVTNKPKERAENSNSVPKRGQHTETYGKKPVKQEHATDKWDEFLGPKPHTDKHPRTGKPDPNRIVSKDGERSIRYGDHEMGSKPTKHHYHEETWTHDPSTKSMNVDNTVVRVPKPKE